MPREAALGLVLLVLVIALTEYLALR